MLPVLALLRPQLSLKLSARMGKSLCLSMYCLQSHFLSISYHGYCMDRYQVTLCVLAHAVQFEKIWNKADCQRSDKKFSLRLPLHLITYLTYRVDGTQVTSCVLALFQTAAQFEASSPIHQFPCLSCVWKPRYVVRPYTVWTTARPEIPLPIRGHRSQGLVCRWKQGNILRCSVTAQFHQRSSSVN